MIIRPDEPLEPSKIQKVLESWDNVGFFHLTPFKVEVTEIGAKTMANTGMVKALSLEGDNNTDNLFLYVEKTLMGGAVGYKYNVTENAQLWGDTYIAFVLSESGSSTEEELRGDTDEDHYLVEVPTESLAGMEVGVEYEAFSYTRRGSQVLVIVLPSEEDQAQAQAPATAPSVPAEPSSVPTEPSTPGTGEGVTPNPDPTSGLPADAVNPGTPDPSV